ncbi:MAG: carboxypeptidase regulatory-like domain-containing protein [Sandaracinaceae bacterium]|nr:carboxypeptidase regulatory-like domain-containing protein [Sandaracinaceae bacterium]
MRRFYWEEWTGFLEPKARPFDVAREVAVVLTGQGTPAAEQGALRFHNGSLFPATVVLRAGQTALLRNEDACPYELFAEGNAELPPVQTAPGQSRPLQFSAPGNWPLRDRNFPHVRGHLHVLSDLIARASVDPNGSFVFRGIEPGSYTIRVFHGSREVLPGRAVQVGDAKEVVIEPISLPKP